MPVYEIDKSDVQEVLYEEFGQSIDEETAEGVLNNYIDTEKVSEVARMTEGDLTPEQRAHAEIAIQLHHHWGDIELYLND
ncbi:hypothetical protein [Neptuniibacter sp. QD37_11]|uniref:hypothetical protein n=1 Tax=Neptuniibacter sp. QD37_11 TaxID=3398209 RepID=UPI0039F5BB35